MSADPYLLADAIAEQWGECPHCGETVRRGEACGCAGARRAAREERRLRQAEDEEAER